MTGQDSVHNQHRSYRSGLQSCAYSTWAHKAWASCAIVASLGVASHALAKSPTLEKVQKAGVLNCGISGALAGFSYSDSKGQYQGLDVDFCRAVGTAIGVKVNFKPLTAQTRFPALQSGEIDLLSRNTTWTLTRDAKLSFDFIGIMFYDGQGFIINKKAGVKEVNELDGAAICVQSGTTTELNLNDYFRRNNLKYKSIVFERYEDAKGAYQKGRCDVFTADASALAALRSGLKKPNDHIILKARISKEPLGPLVRHGDSAWGDLVRWVRNLLLLAEEKGITSKNLDSFKNTKDPEIRRMLGLSDDYGKQLGLKPDWAKNVIRAQGNYAEIFERNVGKSTPLKLERGQNALWTEGGLMYAPPFR